MIKALAKRFPRFRIRLQTLILALGILATVLIMLLFTLLFSRDIHTFVQEQSASVYTRQIGMLAKRIDYSLTKVRSYAELLRADKELEALVLQYAQSQSVVTRMDTRDLLEKYLRKYVWSQSDIEGAAILTSHGLLPVERSLYALDTIQSLQNCIEDVDLFSLPEGFTLLRTTRPLEYTHFNPLKAGTLLYASPLYAGDELAAVYIVFLDYDFLRNLMLDETMSGVQMGNTLIYGSDACVLNEAPSGNLTITLRDSGQSRLFSQQLTGSGLVLTIMEDLNTTYAAVQSMNKVLLCAILLCVAIAWFFGQKIFSHMLTPMKALGKQVAQYERDPDVPNPVEQTRHRFSLQSRLIAFLTLTVLIPILIYLGIYYVTAYDCVHSTMLTAYDSLIQTSVEDIELTLQEQQNLLSTIVYSQAQEEAAETLEDQYTHICQLWNTDLNLIAWNDERIVFSSDTLLGQIYSPPAEMPPMGVSLGKPTDTLIMKQYVPIYMVIPPAYRSRPMPDFVALVNLVEPEVLQNTYIEAQLAGFDVAICDQAGTVLSSTNSGLVGQIMSPEAQAQYNVSIHSSFFDIQMHFAYNAQKLLGGINTVLFNRIYQIFIAFLLLILVFGWICRVLMRPLEHIRGLLDRHLLEDIDELYQSDSIITEVDALGNSFNHMKEHIDGLMDDLMLARMQSYQIEIDRREAEIHSLQSQIHPHFLCNLLETICYLNIDGKHQEANSMLRDLGNLFRYSLSKEQPVVTLEEDLAYTKAFANILQQKHENITIHWQVEKSALQRKVLRLLIQPLVENAVLHGFKGRGSGSVLVSIKDLPDGIEVIVSDDGVGMDLENVALGVGLKNVKKRIELYYREQGKFSLFSAPEIGTTVRLFLPSQLL